MKNLLYSIVVLTFTVTSIFAQVDRTKAPQAAPAPKIQIGDYTKFELANGLKVFVVENHRLPRVSYSISLIFDPETEGANTGIGSVTSELIGTGTKTRTKDQINEEVDFIAASLSANSEGIYASSLKKHTEKLLDVFADVTMNSVFKNEELEKIRTQSLSGIAANKDDPNSISANVSSALTYGKSHPYGEFETESSIKNISLDMCSQYYQKYFNPNIAYLAIVGDINPAEAKKLIEKYFGKWKKGIVKSPTYLKPQPPKSTVVAIVDRPQSVQSVINISYPVDINIGSPDFIKTRVTNTILGGGIFRLFLNLREKHAFTYGAYSNFNYDPIIGNFKASTSVRNAVTDSAVGEILYEMKRLREEPVQESELKMVKNYMMGNFALSLERPQTIASFAINTERYKLPKDFYSTYLKRIEAITPSDIQETAKKYILPDQSEILVVGKASEIAEKLKKYSKDGKLDYYDVDANPYDPSQKGKTLPVGVTAQSILKQYVEAIGGIANISKVKNLTMKGKVSVQGMALSMNIVYKFPGKYLSEIVMNGQTVQKQVLNDGKGKISGMQGAKDLLGPELEKIKMEAELVPELKYESLGYKTELKEISQVSGKDAYMIEVTSPSKAITVDYFSVETGLKVKSITEQDSPTGKISQVTELLEFTEVNGLKFPNKMKQSAGPQTFEVSVDEIIINTDVKDEIFN